MTHSRLFGTDGIRGKYGENLTGDIAYRLGNALVRRRCGAIVVGRDTRLSGGELYKYLRKGILDAGGDIIYLGIVPTPLVAYATTHAKASFGVVITASHNPPEYNGLKVFGESGMKISDEIERALENDMYDKIFVANHRGKEVYGEEYIESYKKCLKEAFSEISGLNVGIDVGNGALSTIGCDVYRSILKDTLSINDDGNGGCINVRSGALYPESLLELVRTHHLDMGFAFDGDGDRICAVTPSGDIINGDRMIYAIARYLHDNGELTNNIVVGTPYTNMGIERDLLRHGITLVRSDVGDSNVALSMAMTHASLGGERAGHIILSKYGMTGDALLVSLFLTNIVSHSGKTLDEITKCDEYPTYSGDFYAENAYHIVEVNQDIVDEAKSRLGASGRIIVRASGTEPKIRVMVECRDETLGRDVLSYVTHELEDKKSSLN